MAPRTAGEGPRGQRTDRRALSVGFVLLPQFTLTAFSSIVDLLRLSADEGDRSRPERCAWTILSQDGHPITASCGIAVLPWETFANPGRFDYIVVVGGLLDRGPTYHPSMLDFLRAAAAEGVAIAGICTGSFALAEAGLLHGRRCCVSWYHFQDLIARYGDIIPVADRLFVEDGPFITCAGGLAALDLGAWMIERHLGPGYSQKSLHIMVTDRARPAVGAQPQPPGLGVVDDPHVRRAMLLIEQNLSTPPKAADLACKVGLSNRQLERRFRSALGKSIQEFSRELRAYYGLWLLADSSRTVAAAAAESGFSDTSHFNRVFRAVFGCAPSALRKEGAPAIKSLIERWQQARAIATPRGSRPSANRAPGPAADGGFLRRERRPYL